MHRYLVKGVISWSKQGHEELPAVFKTSLEVLLLQRKGNCGEDGREFGAFGGVRYDA